MLSTMQVSGLCAMRDAARGLNRAHARGAVLAHAGHQHAHGFAAKLLAPRNGTARPPMGDGR